MDTLFVAGGVVWLIVVVFLVVLAILWLILPFSVFGIKDRLDRLTTEQQKTNQLLGGDLLATMKAVQKLLVEGNLSNRQIGDGTRQSGASQSVTCPHCSKLTRITITESKALYTCQHCQKLFEVEA